MPYYLHDKRIDVHAHPSFGVPFATAAEAGRALKAAARTHKVTFVPTAAQAADWREREQLRFDDDTYIELPFEDIVSALPLPATHPFFALHYAHISLAHPGMIAYTPSEEWGVQDRQLRVRPVKYLRQHLSAYITDAQIQEFESMVRADAYTLRLARTADEIEWVYSAAETRPDSCMSKPADEYESSCHPVRVYGDSDLAVAWYGTDDCVSARAICWPERKVYGRIYGGAAVLERLLQAAGYTSGSMIGARVRRIEDNGRIIMPYVDGVSYARVLDATWIALGRSGDVKCSRTDGYSTDSTPTCVHCEREISASDADDYDGHCESCYNDRWVCNDCGDASYDYGESVDIDGDAHCLRCARRHHGSACEVCGELFVEALITSRRDDAHINQVCEDCAREGYEWCDTCRNWELPDHSPCNDEEEDAC